MQTIMNKSDVTGNRKELRNHSTSAEATLWKMLKGKQIAGLKFRRQHSVGPYILDFYCPQIKLAIELSFLTSPFASLRLLSVPRN